MQQAFLPRILDCGRYIGGSPTMTRLYRLVKDYEMDYNNTARLMELDGRVFRLSPGQIVFRRPGQTVDTAGPLDIYMLTLDYSHSVSPITNNFHLYSPLLDSRQVDHPPQPETDAYLPSLLPVVFEPRHSLELLTLYRRLAVVFGRPGCEAETQDLLSELLHLLTADVLADRRSSRSPSAVDMAVDYLNEHFTRRITLDELAAHVHQNKSYLIRRFKQETGETPMGCLARIRLSNARRLLIETGCSVAVAAQQCGFEDPSYFTLRFRRAFGCTPAAWRNAHHVVNR